MLTRLLERAQRDPAIQCLTTSGSWSGWTSSVATWTSCRRSYPPTSTATSGSRRAPGV